MSGKSHRKDRNFTGFETIALLVNEGGCFALILYIIVILSDMIVRCALSLCSRCPRIDCRWCPCQLN